MDHPNPLDKDFDPNDVEMIPNQKPESKLNLHKFWGWAGNIENLIYKNKWNVYVKVLMIK